MKPHRTAAKDPLNGNKISEILLALPNHFSTPLVSMNALSEALSGRAYGMLLLVLALPNLIPIPAPGLSFVAGAPLMLVTLQMMLGRTYPWMPGFIGNRTIKTEQLQRLCMRAVPLMKALERVTSPRLQILAKPPADRVVAFICMALSLMIMMPIPFGNALPAFAICIFAIGLMQRDGLFILAGLTATLLGTAAISAFIAQFIDWLV